MREILFRGMTDSGKWAIGLLAHIKDSWYISNKAGIATAFEVMPETIGQYTGLKDKNGTKIFEGDILRTKYRPEEDMCVEYYDGSFRFKILHNHGCHQYKGEYSILCFIQNAVSHLKVIGNIYDNPELLEVEK